MLQTAAPLWDAARASLSGSVTIITGAGRGMGKETAQQLLALGGKVAIVDLDQDRLGSAAADLTVDKGELLTLKADVMNESQVGAMVEETMRRFARIDHLVNCAGAYRAKSPSLQVDSDEWDVIVDSNLKGTFNCCRAVLPHMVAQRRGAIVNISSLAGRTCSPFLGVHYSAAKAGVLGLTRHLANEFGPSGVRVNAIAPGTMLGERVSEIASNDGLSKQAEGTPLGRLATPRDIAGVITFLISDLSAFITGATIDVNGGVLTI
jgi:NAD(P)-dependent dehydrogenase (short-subunit alcohol dehydrogenase family)